MVKETTEKACEKKTDELAEANKKGLIFLTPKHLTSIIERLTQKNSSEGSSAAGQAVAEKAGKSHSKTAQMPTGQEVEEEKLTKQGKDEDESYSLSYDGDEGNKENENPCNDGSQGEEEWNIIIEDSPKKAETEDMHQQFLGW